MGKLIDLSGQRFEKWLVIADAPVRDGKTTRWLCACDCGMQRLVEASSLRDGQSTNCGCDSKTRTHGASGTPEYNSWNAMHQRCRSKADYRGVTIANRWRGAEGFSRFLSDMGPRPPGTTLDRIKNHRGYAPGNCRWATPLMQTMNRSNARNVTLDGVEVPLRTAVDAIRDGIRRGERFTITRAPLPAAAELRP